MQARTEMFGRQAHRQRAVRNCGCPGVCESAEPVSEVWWTNCIGPSSPGSQRYSTPHRNALAMARSHTQRRNTNLSNLMVPQICIPTCYCTDIGQGLINCMIPSPKAARPVRRWLKGLQDVDDNVRQTTARVRTHLHHIHWKGG